MKNIQSFLKDQVDQHQSPSIQYVFFDTDSIIYEIRYGWKNVKTKQPIDNRTTYHLFSITKTFTALALLQLVQEGKIQLNKPVSDYLPAFPYNKQITVEQLLSHTSGIPNPLPLKWIHLAEEHDDFHHDEFFKEIFIRYPKLLFSPGTKFKYSNLGYVVLGQLIESVSGRKFEDYVRTNILEKNGIDPVDMNFHLDPERHAVGYHKRWSFSNALLGLLINKRKFMGGPEGRWKPFNHFYNNGKAYGGMFGTANGLVRYAQALLADHSVLINDEFKAMLFSERVINNKPTGMSFSWFTGTLKGYSYVAHAGGGGGYYVELRIYPALGVGSVIMYNRSGMKDERILDQVDSFFLAVDKHPALPGRKAIIKK